MLIAWGSFLPSDDFEAVTFNLYDKIVHIGAYGILSFSWFLALRRDRKTFKAYSLTILGIVSYGIIIEVLQGVLSDYRKADINDILANFIGVMLAFILFYFRYDKIEREP